MAVHKARLFVLGGTVMSQSKSHLKLRALCEGAIFVALSFVLSLLPVGKMPQGGSFDLAMLPLLVFCVRWGFGPAMQA